MMYLRQALRSVPSHTTEQILRQVAVKLSQALTDHMMSSSGSNPSSEKIQALFSQVMIIFIKYAFIQYI